MQSQQAEDSGICSCVLTSVSPQHAGNPAPEGGVMGAPACRRGFSSDTQQRPPH